MVLATSRNRSGELTEEESTAGREERAKRLTNGGNWSKVGEVTPFEEQTKLLPMEEGY